VAEGAFRGGALVRVRLGRNLQIPTLGFWAAIIIFAARRGTEFVGEIREVSAAFQRREQARWIWPPWSWGIST